MNTRIITIDENNIDEELLKEAGDIIKRGGLVAFPTETVYGLGGDALNPESSRKIYAAKGRPSDNPLIIHIAKYDDLFKIVKNIPNVTKRIADEFWPGPLTMIFDKADSVPYETTGGLDTVAVRFPSNPIAQKFIELSGGFVAAPSANRSGRPSPTVAKYVVEDLDGRIEMIIDGGSSDIGLESTIIDMTVNPPMILRPGYILPKDFERIINDVDIDRTVLDADSDLAPKAPGMKYKHYAPQGELTVVHGVHDEVIGYINNTVSVMEQKGIKAAVLTTDESMSEYSCRNIKSLGLRSDNETIAHNLFRVLRELDDEGIEIIYSESFDDGGLNWATMNRLLKAAGHKEVYL